MGVAVSIVETADGDQHDTIPLQEVADRPRPE